MPLKSTHSPHFILPPLYTEQVTYLWAIGCNTGLRLNTLVTQQRGDVRGSDQPSQVTVQVASIEKVHCGMVLAAEYEQTELRCETQRGNCRSSRKCDVYVKRRNMAGKESWPKKPYLPLYIQYFIRLSAE